MNKIGFVAPRKGGKTDFILTMIKEELSQGHKCYYLGGQKHYQEILEKLKLDDGKEKLLFVSKDVFPSDDSSAVFTDNITWEVTSIFPYTVRTMAKLKGNWYYTVSEEELVFPDSPKKGD